MLARFEYGGMTDTTVPDPTNSSASDGDGQRSTASRVLLPLTERSRPDGVTTLARALAGAHGEVLVTQVVAVPEQTPLEAPEGLLTPHREAIRESVREVAGVGDKTPVEGVVRIGHRWSTIVARTADEHDAKAIVTSDVRRRSSLLPFRRSNLDRLRARTACRLVTTKNDEALVDVSSILVPVAGGPHSQAAVDVARALATYHDAWIDLLHVVDRPPTAAQRRRGSGYLETAGDRLGDAERWDTWLLEADDVVDAIVDQSAYYDATVLGAPQKGRLERFAFGSTSADVREGAENAVVTVRGER